MRDYIVWDFTKDEVRQDTIDGMGRLVKKEHAAVESSDIAKSEYIAKEAWGYYPWVNELFKKAEIVMGKKIGGRVADIGSGTGIAAALLSKQDEVKEVYAIEYSEEFVKDIMPVTFCSLQAEEDKITKVWGSFNSIELPDNYFDYVCEVNSLHHSENLDVTLKELRRVLKPGGYIVAADRGQANWVSKSYLGKLLEIQLSPRQKKFYGLPENFTRGMWGEHEYRFKDWKEIFARNGFKPYTFVFPRKNPKILGSIAKIMFELMGDYLLRHKMDFLPYYRWFLPYFKGSNMLLVAQCIKGKEGFDERH